LINYGVASPEQLKDKTGLQILREMISGVLPSPTIFKTLRFHAIEANEGHVVFTGQTAQDIMNPQGTVHGGWALAIIDSITGCAAHSTLPANTMYTTVETKSNFNRPIQHDLGEIRAEGWVLSKGRTIITAEGKIFDSKGKLLAHGTSTLFVLP
jgi:uncharacterized protein (TIGR00369 family)